MKVFLHIGAHRTGSTSLQTYMRQNKNALNAQGVGFWGPMRLRKGLIYDVMPNALTPLTERRYQRACMRIQMQLDSSRSRGIDRLLVSEENMIGTMRHNFKTSRLYPSAGQRVARFARAFGPNVGGIVLSIRALDSYWTSAMTYCVKKGIPVAGAQKVQSLAAQTHNWRDVITDIAVHVPDLPITVATFEYMAGRPQELVGFALGKALPACAEPIWRNARPTVSALLDLPLTHSEANRLRRRRAGERWMPFDPFVIEAMRERYHDDIFWLRAGADGLATLIDEHTPQQAGAHLPLGDLVRGQHYDQNDRLARPG